MVESVPGACYGKFRRGRLHGQIERAEAEVRVPGPVIDKFGDRGNPDFGERLDDDVDGVFPVGPALWTFDGYAADWLFLLV